MPPKSSILYHSPDSSLIIIDIPLSLELAQDFPPTSKKRIISSTPLETPYLSLEPKSKKAREKAKPVELDDLLLARRLEFALREVRDGFEGAEWYLPRILGEVGRDLDSQQGRAEGQRTRKRRKTCPSDTPASHTDHTDTKALPPSKSSHTLSDIPSFLQNTSSSPTTLPRGEKGKYITIPPHSTYLQGDLESTLQRFTAHAPKFNLILLDPPWPNRSAFRSKSYTISSSTPEIQALLSSLPLSNHLAPNGLIGIWITNKPLFRHMVLSPGGLFSQYGVELIEEWTWLKITKAGESICALDGTWRKPYEIFLLGRQIDEAREKELEVEVDVERRITFGVPDLHSRKPNLSEVFKELGLLEKGGRIEGEGEGEGEGKIECLEIFARNMTAGWWSWGDEVLKFQGSEWWVDDVDSGSDLTPEEGINIKTP